MDQPPVGFWFLNTWKVLGRGKKDKNLDMYKKQSGALLQKLWCSEEALYVYNIVQRSKSCHPKTLPPQVDKKGLDLLNVIYHRGLQVSGGFFLFMFELFCLLKGLLFPKFCFP